MRLRARHEAGAILVEQEEGYSAEAKVILRNVSLDSRREGAIWRYSFSQGALSALIEAADLLQAQLELDEYLRKVLRTIEDENQREFAIRKFIQVYIDRSDMVLEPYICLSEPQPWRHQQIAYHWGMRVGALYLAHKPGLGKTRTAADLIRGRILLGHVHKPEISMVQGRPVYRGGVLIMCPKTVIWTWRDEIWRWQRFYTSVFGANLQKRLIHPSAWIHLVNYGSLNHIQDNEYDFVIADEAHYLANSDTKRFAKALAIRRKAKFALAMSGTPISNMLPSLWAQYFWLDGGRTLGPSLEYYYRRYFETSSKWKPEAKLSSLSNIARQIARVTYFLTMQEAFPGKPRKIQQILRISMSREQIRYYDQVRTQALTDIKAGRVSAEKIHVKLMKLLEICQGFVIDDEGMVKTFTSAKVDTLISMLTGQGDLTDRKVVVWCQFRHDLQSVTSRLTAAGVSVLYLHGDLKQREREQVIHAWNHQTQYRVLVGMIHLGIGINLHAPKCVDAVGVPDRCSTTVFFGFNWRVTSLEQAMDRVYRGDQVETCLYRYLVSEDYTGIRPIDANIYDLLMLKLEQGVELSEASMGYVRRLLGEPEPSALS